MDNQQERPNYGVEYDIIVGDLCTSHEKGALFAQNDADARRIAQEHVNRQANGYVNSRLVRLVRFDYDANGNRAISNIPSSSLK